MFLFFNIIEIPPRNGFLLTYGFGRYIITIMWQSKNQVQYNDCIFCDEQQEDGLFFMMNDALKVKYIENPKDFSSNYIDSILRMESPNNQQEALAGCLHRQYLILDDQDEFLKREYELQEYGGKITQLSEYYKFHNDIPKVVESGIERIMGKYHDKKRECDYKKIKRVLKQEQGLSITSVQQSQSQIADSQFVKKSRYSTLLNSISQSNLNDLSQSKILQDLCKQIDKAIPKGKTNGEYNFKGAFPEEKMFEYYLKSQEQKLKDKLKERNRLRQGGKVLGKKFNYQEFVKSREKATDESKETKIAKQEKKQEKDSKFVYNTNIKIQIRNAMFYSQGQPGQPALHMTNLEYDNTKVDNRFKKKSPFPIPTNLKQYRSNQKLASDIYKSSNHDLRLRNYAVLNNQRLSTKENVDKSRSKQKRRSNSKHLLQGDSKKNIHTLSARKLAHNNQWILSRQPARSLSTSTIKKRSISTHGVTQSTSTKRLQKGSLYKRPIEGISRYGSSQYSAGVGIGGGAGVILGPREGKTTSIKQLLNRKLKFKLQ